MQKLYKREIKVGIAHGTTKLSSIHLTHFLLIVKHKFDIKAVLTTIFPAKYMYIVSYESSVLQS